MTIRVLIFATFIMLFMWLGWAFYMNTLDALLFPPITTFTDQMKLKTDKDVYKPGDIVSIQNSFCKNRNYTAVTTWKLLDGTVITFPSTGSKVSTVGCVTNKWFVIGQIPLYATHDIHHLEATTEIQVNSQKKIYLNFRSQDFLVNN